MESYSPDTKRTDDRTDASAITRSSEPLVGGIMRTFVVVYMTLSVPIVIGKIVRTFVTRLLTTQKDVLLQPFVPRIYTINKLQQAIC